MAAAAQPDHESQCVDQLLSELAGPGGEGGADGGSAFSTFARRARALITGLVHISVLLLPRQHEDDAGPVSNSARVPAGSSAKGGGGAGAAAGGSRAVGAPAADAAAELAAAGFPSDGSDLEEWQRVQGLLEHTATGGLDWDSCCVFRISEEAGAAVEAQPPYPVSCTAAYHAAQVKRDVLIAQDYPAEGPHFADWAVLHAGGARSMAAAPMFVQQRVVGVLSLASRDPHAFERSRLVWMLALVLAPFAAALRYTSQALEVSAFVQRIMPPLLEQNYERNAAGRRSAASSPSSAKPGRPAQRGGDVAAALPPADGSATLSLAAAGSGGKATPPPSGSDQFAQNAEVLITGGSGRAAATSHSDDGAAAPQPGAAAAAPPLDKALLPRSGNATAANGAAAPPPRKAGRAARSSSGGKPTALVANGWASAADGASQPGEAGKAAVGVGRAADCFDPAALDPYLSGYDSDLDWGDFFFNLVSMCIVYAYFSEAAVAGESQAAIVVSMCIAAVDILLLALRWLWYEQYITYGGAVLQVFQMYRLVVLPVANTWMSWSLLHKLGITPGPLVVATSGAAVAALIVAGVQTRFLLHAPLQLASVLFAASSTTEVCGRFFASTTSLGCMAAMSLLQLSLGVLLPSIMCHALDMRSAADKPFLPHVQAKRWLLQS